MHSKRLNRRLNMDAHQCQRRAVERLRCAYFAQAGELAARYRVRFERVLQHLWNARRINPRLLLRFVLHVDDLVHAIACVDNVGLAWADLSERYELTLIRRCRHGHDEIEATLLVRRLLADLRRRNQAQCSIHAPALCCYAGTRPLRNWLSDRLSAARTEVALMNLNMRRAQMPRAIGSLKNGTFNQPVQRLAIAQAAPLLRIASPEIVVLAT